MDEKCIVEGMVETAATATSLKLMREYFFSHFYRTHLFIDFTLRTMCDLSVGEENHSLGFTFC